MKPYTFGIVTFLESGVDEQSGKISHKQRLDNAIEEIVLADRVGLDYYGIGEHHRSDYAASSPQMILSAAAKLTSHIHLGSAVTVLSSSDPVRIYEEFATLDLLSNGRAEIMAGRGSFIESFPLFGYDLNDYQTLFTEKLDMLLAVRDQEKLTWPGGKHTPKLDNVGIYPRSYQKQLKVSIAVGGTQSSVVRAAKLGLPLVLAILGGSPLRFKPFVDLYKHFYLEAGYDPKDRSEERTSELQSRPHLVCRLLLEKKNFSFSHLFYYLFIFTLPAYDGSLHFRFDYIRLYLVYFFIILYFFHTY